MQGFSHLANFAKLAARAPLNTIQVGSRAKANAAAASNSSSSAADGIGSTFLSLLTKELENQDPTAPVDSTAMVGQMISLNQLDQLIAINQTLSQTQQGSTSSSSTPSSTAETAVASSKPAPSSSTSTPAVAGTQQLPFAPQTLMPRDMKHPGGALAPNIPGLNSATWNTLQFNEPQMAAGRK